MAYSYAKIERLHYHLFLTYYVFKVSKCFSNRFIDLLSSYLSTRLGISGIRNLLRNAVYVALILHDIGKAYAGYQERMKGPYGEVSFKYHELLSALITYSYLKELAEGIVREVSKDPNTRRELRRYIVIPSSLAVLMHHEALRDYTEVLNRLSTEVRELLNEVESKGFVIEEVALIQRILHSLGIREPVLNEVIDKLLKEGLHHSYTSFRRDVRNSQGSPEVNYLTTNITAAIQLCDRFAATIVRSDVAGITRRLEREFMSYCLDLSESQDIDKLRRNAVRELTKIFQSIR